MIRPMNGQSTTTDLTHVPDLTPYLSAIVIGALFLWVFWFPTVAAIVAPNGRRFEFFFLTLLVLFGPLGVACAAVANPRSDRSDS
jgi:hypothetical protein